MTANQRYRQYKKDGGTLSFADYMNREKKKGFVNFDGQVDVPENKPLSDSLTAVLNQMHQTAGYKTKADNKYILGLHRNVWIGTGIVAAAVVAYVVYKNQKK